MTREEALKHIEELETIAREHNFKIPPLLEFYEDLAKHYGMSLEDFVDRYRTIVGGVGRTRPIRTKSCKFCKYFVEFPKVISLCEEQQYWRFCTQSGLNEPIDDTWELEHELCFVRKENENAENKG